MVQLLNLREFMFDETKFLFLGWQDLRDKRWQHGAGDAVRRQRRRGRHHQAPRRRLEQAGGRHAVQGHQVQIRVRQTIVPISCYDWLLKYCSYDLI